MVSRLVLLTPSACYVDDGDYHGGFVRADIDDLLDDDGAQPARVAGRAVRHGGRRRPRRGPDELEDTFCRTRPEVALQFATVTFRSDNRSDLTRVAAPTLVLQVRDDVIAPMSAGEFVHEQIAGSRLRVLETRGHAPHLTDPDDVVAEIGGFLDVPVRADSHVASADLFEAAPCGYVVLERDGTIVRANAEFLRLSTRRPTRSSTGARSAAWCRPAAGSCWRPTSGRSSSTPARCARSPSSWSATTAPGARAAQRTDARPREPHVAGRLLETRDRRRYEDYLLGADPGGRAGERPGRLPGRDAAADPDPARAARDPAPGDQCRLPTGGDRPRGRWRLLRRLPGRPRGLVRRPR